MNTTVMQILCLVIFLLAMRLFGRGIGVLKRLTMLAGSAMFIMSMLFIAVVMAAPILTNGASLVVDWSPSSFIPDFNVSLFLSLSILAFAVGGCERISPYVSKIRDPSGNFAKGMAILTAVVAVTAILSTIALDMMFDSNHTPQGPMINGACYAFQKLGEYCHVGNFSVTVYAPTDPIGQFSIIVLPVDAPLRVLLGSADSRFTSSRMFEKNEHGAHVNGHRLVTLIVYILTMVPVFGIRSVDVLVRWLVKINLVCMSLRYLWVFVAYIALRRAGNTFCGEYRFMKGKAAGILVGDWCFALTTFVCLTDIYSDDPFRLVLNIVTPFVLVGFGFVMPWMAAKEKKS